MKRWMLIVLALMLLASCRSTHEKSVSAAMEVYEQYADHSDQLMAAVIADYEVEGITYNAVMFQALDSAEWEWLKAEFGVVAPTDSLFLPYSGELGSMPPAEGVVMSSYFVDTNLHFETEADLLAHIDSVARRTMQGMGIENSDSSPIYIVEIDSNSEIFSKVSPQTVLANRSREHGEAGYVISTDNANQTLWLFFYATPEEQAVLLQRLYAEFNFQ